MIRIEDNIDEFLRSLSDVAQKQLPFAIAMALNDTAKDMLDEEKEHMAQVFDRPTRWTLNAFFVKKANKRNLTATIQRKSYPGRRFYLEVQNKGGTRRRTGIETLIASRLRYAGSINAITPAAAARRNASGNMSPAQVQRILLAVQAQRDSYQNTTASSRARARGREQYFVPRPGSKLSPGIWQRTSRRSGVKKVLHFTSAMPTYSKRFRFEEVATRKARQVFPRHLSVRLRQAIETAR